MVESLKQSDTLWFKFRKSLQRTFRAHNGKGVIFGFVGGLAPLMVNAGHQWVHQNPAVPEKNVGLLFAGMLVFAAVGALVVYMSGEKEPYKAFIMGIGAPAMITLTAQKPAAQTSGHSPSPSHERARVATGGGFFAVSAHAADPTLPPASLPGRRLEVQAKGAVDELAVVVEDIAGRELRTVTLKRLDFERLSLPSEAAKVRFRKGRTVTQSYPLPDQPGGVIYYEVAASNPRRVFNFLSAVTKDSPVLYDLQVRQVSIAVIEPGTSGWAYIGKREGGDWRQRYLDFAGAAPEVGRSYTVTYTVTFLDNFGSNAKRLGRLETGQKVTLHEFRADARGPADSNKLFDVGDYYARVTVESRPR